MKLNIKVSAFIALGVIIMVLGTWFFTSIGPELKAIQDGEILPFQVDYKKPLDLQMGGFHNIVSVEILNNGYDFGNNFLIC